LLHRLDSNLDYFGHPAGWVPNLSFEANLGLFSSEAESAIRVLYLSYWLGNVASSLQQKADGMANSRAQLASDFNALTNELGSTQVRLSDLEVKSSVTESNLARLETALSNRVDQLRRLAEQAAANAAKKAKKNKWRKAVKSVGSILAVSPVGAPILNAIGSGMVLAADVRKPSDLVRDWGHVQNVAKAFRGGAFSSSVRSFKDAVKPLDAEILDKHGWSNYTHGISVKSKELSKRVKENQQRLKPKEAAANAVENFLARFRAEAPELNQPLGDPQADGLMDQVAGAARELQQLNIEITDAMQQMARLTGEIQRHILAVDAMNRDVSALNAVLDHRALVHLKEMDRGAKERLRKYQYYLAKSYEYRFLEP
jgi:chromosome segregation ATPase